MVLRVRLEVDQLLRAVALSLGGISALVADCAYGLSPAEEAEREGLVRMLAEYPEHEKIWRARRDRVFTYTVRQSESGLILGGPCEGLPISVRVVDGKLKKATYAASAGRCRIGSPARTRGLYLTPSQLFQRIRHASEQLKCYESDSRSCMATALRVTYDDTYGLPVHMENYSEDLSDYHWSLTITNLRSAP